MTQKALPAPWVNADPYGIASYLLRILCATFVCRALACKHLCRCICYLSIIRSRYVGVELLDYSEGLASGVFDGVRYFRCVSQWREE